MDQVPPLAAGPPLLDLLGARWRVGVSAAAVAWDAATGLAGFALGDGTLALTHPVWEGAPALRPRQGGGMELVPGTAPAPPAARVPVHRGACLVVAADPDGGFLTGGTDGRITRVQADADVRALAHLDGAVTQVAAGPGQWRACAVARTVHRLGGAAARIDLAAPVTSLALEPGGARVAIGCDGGVTLWAGGTVPSVLAAPGRHHGVCWAADRSVLASYTPDGMLFAWRSDDATPIAMAAGVPVSSLGALASGDGFAAAAGGRVIIWRMDGPELATSGVPNQSPVTRIACHPHRAIVAAGYANGTVVLCQPDSAALLFVRPPGEGAVTALAFAPTGDRLAIGTDGGDIAVLPLIDQLLRDRASQT